MQLTIIDGPMKGKVVPLGGSPIVFGRQSDVTVTLDDKKVSRQHATIEQSDDGTCVLRDLGSTNHTYVNDRPIRSAVLEEGDRIRIGSSEILFSEVSPVFETGPTDVELECLSLDEGDLSFMSSDWGNSDIDVEISLEMTPQTLRAALHNDDPEHGQLQESLYAIGLLSSPEALPLDLLVATVPVIASSIKFDHWLWVEWPNSDSAHRALAAATSDGVSVAPETISPSRTLLERARSENRGMVSDELSQAFELSMALRPDEVSSALVVPLSCRDGGCALYLERCGSAPQFTARDLERAAILGTQIATALENSRLFDELREAYDSLDRYLNQLNKTEKLASIGRLASGFAHDLNNPLSSVLGFLELAARVVDQQVEGEVQAKLAKYLGNAQHAADFCRALSRNVLSFARQTPFNDAQKQTFSVYKTICNTLAICDSNLRRTGAEIVIDAPEDLLIVGDSSALQQLIMNLVTNASDAIGESGREDGLITVRARRQNEVIIVEVEDNGPGIPEHLRTQIFEPLFTTKGESKGTGLGLFVVSSLIADAGGRLDFRSEVGKGTTFVVELPHTLTRTHTDLSSPLTDQCQDDAELTSA